MLVATAVVLWSAPAASDQPGWGLEIVESDMPDTVPAGETLTVDVVLRNTGNVSWEGGDGWSVAAHWWDEGGEIVDWEGPRTPFDRVVDAGDSLRLTATVQTPREPGRYQLGWDVVHDGVLWVTRVAHTEPSRISVEVAATHAMTLRADSPRVMVTDSRRSIPLEVINDGTLTWTGDGGIAVAAHWLDRSGDPVVWEGPRTPIPHPVSRGGRIALDAIVDAPSAPGVYRLQWDLVHEGVCWFSDRDPSIPEPTIVIVVPRVPITAGWVLLVAVAAWWTVRRPSATGGLPAIADVLWWMGTVAVKEWVVLAETGQPPDASGILLAVGGAALLVLPAVLLPTGWRPWFVWSLGAVVSTVLWADALHLRFFNDLISVSAVRSIGQLDEIVASVANLARWRDLLLFADLVVVVPLVRRAAASRRPRWWAALPVVAAVAAASIPAVRLTTYEGGTLRQVFRSTILAREIGVLDTHAVDVIRTAARGARVRTADPEDVAFAERYLRATASLRAAVGPSAGASRGANLVMIQVESLQDFVIGLEVESQEVTPFLNRWSDLGVRFTEITDQTAQGRSSDAELATQVSLLPPA